MTKNLFTPILERGLRNVHYFNGRLLSARDLEDNQKANRHQHAQLGRALGHGVVTGLDVSVKHDGADGASPVLTVTAGLALNGKGQALELPQEETVTLVREPAPVPAGAGLFGDCQPPNVNRLKTGAGFYLLALSPASGFSIERAPMSGLDAGGRVVGCGSRYTVEGVQFQLLPLDLDAVPGVSVATRELLRGKLAGVDRGNPAKLSRLRNVAAHVCFGTETVASFAADPFPPTSASSRSLAYGAFDHLVQQKVLSTCDVPLALVCWTLKGLAFVDTWAVRRRPVPRVPSVRWPTLGGERRWAEAEAVVFQFQEQLEQLIAEHTNPSAIRAEKYFRYLPPAGFIPTATGIDQDLDFSTFFEAFPYRRTEFYQRPEFSGFPELIDGAILPAFLAESFLHQPVDLETREMVWLYQPSVQGPNRATPRTRAPYMVFASCHLPPQGAARFDVARWDHSNFARPGAASADG